MSTDDNDFHKTVLRGATKVVAPMVDASELAWRILSRRHGADLCVTPMLHAGVFIRDEKYRRDNLQTCAEDRPLIVQFCTNDPKVFREAVRLTKEAIDFEAIDINLGCPQVIARRGHFGSFLQDEWELIASLVKAGKDLAPITCKLRVFESIEKTVDYAKMMVEAGAAALTVHGRTREQKGALTGLASWKHIKAVREAVSVPVFANGNIQTLDDVKRCIEETGVHGVMSAETHLHNPYVFQEGLDSPPPVWEVCLEYLELAREYPCPTSYSRGHMFKLLHHCLQMKENFDVRHVVAKGSTLDDFERAAEMIKERMEPYHKKEKEFQLPEELKNAILSHPPWICQPYVRPPPEEHLKKLQEVREREKLKLATEARKREGETDEEYISRRKQKKLEKNPNKKFPHSRENCKLCCSCPNPAGQKCERDMCKKCCRSHCYVNELDCSGHRILVKSKREAARRWNQQREEEGKQNNDDTYVYFN